MNIYCVYFQDYSYLVCRTFLQGCFHVRFTTENKNNKKKITILLNKQQLSECYNILHYVRQVQD